MLSILFAAQLSAPEGRPLASLVASHDVPIHELSVGEIRTVAFRLTVRPDGSVQGCTVEAPSGKEKLDRLACNLVRRRARFKGARWLDGKPAWSVVRNSLTWAINPSRRYKTPLDAELRVSSLPKGERSPAVIRLIFAVDAEGHSSSCAAREGKPHPSFLRLACEQFLASHKAVPARDDGGEAVASVQDATVSFVAD